MSAIPCQHVNEINKTLQCLFVQNNSDCQDVEGYLNYVNFVYCDFENVVAPLILCICWLIVLFVGIGTTADNYFCPSLEVISKVLRISHNVAGVTFLAFGNGAPDIFSAVAGAQNMRPELVVGALLGAGIFVTCVVAGSIILTTPFKMMERPFLRDVIFYLVAVILTFYCFYSKEITFYQSLAFIILYIIYIIVVLFSHYIYQTFMKPKNSIPNGIFPPPTIVITHATLSESGKDSCHYEEKTDVVPWGTPPIARRWSSGNIMADIPSPYAPASPSHSVTNLAIPNEVTPLLRPNGETVQFLQHSPFREFCYSLCPFDVHRMPFFPWWKILWLMVKSPVVFILNITIPVVNYDNQSNNWNRHLAILHCVLCPVFFVFAIGYDGLEIGKFVPLWILCFGIGCIVSFIVWFTSENEHPPVYHSAFAFFGFAMSVIWIYLIANEIVSLLKTIGIAFHLSDTILGFTVLAWGNSLGDLIADISIAKQGFPRMGISACFGGPLFNLLLGIGIPFCIVTIEKPQHIIKVVYQRSTTILTGFLSASLVSSLIIIPFVMRFNLRRWYGVYLVILYLVFLVVAIANEMKLF